MQTKFENFHTYKNQIYHYHSISDELELFTNADQGDNTAAHDSNHGDNRTCTTDHSDDDEPNVSTAGSNHRGMIQKAAVTWILKVR